MPPHVHTLTDEELFCLEGCRSYQQYFKMRKGFEAKTCAFCQLDRTFNEVLWEDEFAMAWHVPVDYLRPELRYHGLVVPKRHVRFISDLTTTEVLSVHEGMVSINKRFDYQGGLWHAREGDMRKNAGTVPHLHYNIFEPNETGEVRVPVFKHPGDREANKQRAFNFNAFYAQNVTPSTFDEMVTSGVIRENGNLGQIT